MTADQLTLADCDPAWNLADPGAGEAEETTDRGWRDLRGQITKREYYRMTTVKISGSYL